MVEPAVLSEGVPGCLSTLIDGPAAIGVSVWSAAVGGVRKSGGVPVAVALFATCPASTSAWVSV